MARRPVITERQRAVVLLRELLEGKAHTRQTIAQLLGVSLRTADRWMKVFERLPGIERMKGRPMLTYARSSDAPGETFDRVKRKLIVASRKSAALDAVLDAVWRSRILRFTYRDSRGHGGTIRVQPLSVVVHEGELFLLARECSGEPAFPYRLKQMTDVVVDAASFEYPSRSEYDPDALLSPGFFDVGEPERRDKAGISGAAAPPPRSAGER